MAALQPGMYPPPPAGLQPVGAMGAPVSLTAPASLAAQFSAAAPAAPLVTAGTLAPFDHPEVSVIWPALVHPLTTPTNVQAVAAAVATVAPVALPPSKKDKGK